MKVYQNIIIKKVHALRLIKALAKGIEETDSDFVILDNSDDMPFILFNEKGESKWR